MIGDLVTRLIDAGCPPEVAAVAIAEAFAEGAKSGGSPVDKTADRRRAYDRKRKAEERAASAKSGGSPVESGGSPETPLTLTSSTQKDSIEEEKKVRARKAKSAELPVDWQPTESHFAKAAELGVSREAVLSKAEDMRLWARSTGARKVDWDATFHGFIRRDADKLRASSNGKTKPSFSEIAREIGRSLAANGSDEAGGNVVGLLSDRRSA